MVIRSIIRRVSTGLLKPARISTPVSTRVLTIAMLTSASLSVSQDLVAQDCTDDNLGNYRQQLSAAGTAAAAGEILASLEQSAKACESPAYWQALGDARHLVASSGGGEDLQGSALEAYGNAFSSARSLQNDKAGAKAARSIADLGLTSGDPLKAQNWLVVATRLDPDHTDLVGLQGRLDTARGQLSTSEIDTGLSQTRGIGTVNSLLGGKVSSNAFWDPEDESEGGAGESVASVSGSITTAASSGGEISIDIPIRFDSNSTTLTGETAANVRNLATVLSGKSPQSDVTLIGHADTRGDADYNQTLSLNRAKAIRDLLVEAEPALDGRINAMGAGESNPIDLGDSSRSHANNRRLEVTVKEP